MGAVPVDLQRWSFGEIFLKCCFTRHVQKKAQSTTTTMPPTIHFADKRSGAPGGGLSN
jgi:hypothetical protein